MQKVRIHSLSISLDGFVAGPAQDREHPLGIRGLELHQWIFPTSTFKEMTGGSGGTGGVDDALFHRGFEGVGATIIGRNMFGPIRGTWSSPQWNGWWGEDPPFHHPVFVLTNHPRPDQVMAGGTTFHFVTDGAEAALDRALDAAGGEDVSIGGGASVVRQYLGLELIDEMHLAVVPVLLGEGERIFEAYSHIAKHYRCELIGSTDAAAHFRLTRASAGTTTALRAASDPTTTPGRPEISTP